MESQSGACHPVLYRYIMDDVMRQWQHYDSDQNDYVTWQEFRDATFGDHPSELPLTSRDLPSHSLSVSLPHFPSLPLSFLSLLQVTTKCMTVIVDSPTRT